MAIRCTKDGPVIHINEDEGRFTVSEDAQGRSFDTFELALHCAREIAGDPDVPPSVPTIH